MLGNVEDSKTFRDFPAPFLCSPMLASYANKPREKNNNNNLQIVQRPFTFHLQLKSSRRRCRRRIYLFRFNVACYNSLIFLTMRTTRVYLHS